MNDLNLEAAIETLRWLRDAGPEHEVKEYAVNALERVLMRECAHATEADAEAIENAVFAHKYPSDEEEE